jgi:CRP-like cAMP-binding protein
MTLGVIELLPLFQGLDQNDLAILASLCRAEVYDQEQTVFSQGDKAETMYVLASGRISIRYKPYDGEILTVADVHPGDIFGWSAILRRPAYTSCAVALEPSRVISISGDGLRQLCRARPGAGTAILNRLIEVIPERLKEAHAQVSQILREGMCADDEVE